MLSTPGILVDQSHPDGIRGEVDDDATRRWSLPSIPSDTNSAGQ